MKIINVLILCFITVSTFAQESGDLDTTFQAGWYANATIHASIVQPDGKIIVAGDFLTFNRSSAQKIVRLNPDMTVDETFNIGVGPDNTIFTLCLLPDGKILIGGNFIYIGDYEFHHIARLNSNGTVDPTFNCGTAIGPLLGFPHYISKVNNIVLQPDNKILISGYFNEFDGYERSGIARLNSDGSVDLTFTPPASPIEYYAFELLNDGKIFVANSSLERLNSNGTLDLSFVEVDVSGSIFDIQTLADGKIIIAGDISAVSGYTKYEIARLYADGTLDFSFFPDPIASYVFEFIVLDDGRIITAGSSPVESFNTDGTPDSTFSTSPNGVLNGITKQSDNLIVFGAFTAFNSESRNRISVINFDGTLDSNVVTIKGGVGDDVNGYVRTIEKNGEKIYAAGDFGYFDGKLQKNISNIYEYGGIDPTFITSTYGIFSYGGTIHDIQLVESDKLLIGGSSSLSEKLYRIYPNGSNDPTFVDGSGFGTSDIIYALGLQDDGKYVVGGYINSYNGVAREELLRLTSNGTYDANLSICCSAYTVYSVDFQHDQKILVGGTFIPSTYKYFTRATTSFVNESEFIPAAYTGANGNVHEIIYNDQDSSIFIFGAFTIVNTTPRNSIAKLNPDGSIDFAFDPGTGANGLIRAGALLPDGRILIGGDFTSYNGVPMNHIACIMPNGSLDGSFDPGAGTDDNIYDILVYDNYTAIIGGKFSYYNTSTADKIARIFYSEPLCFDMEVTLNDVICEGGTYTLIDGTIVTGPGTYIATGISTYLCDSTVTYILTEAPVYELTMSAVINSGETYTLPDGIIVSAANTYTSVLTSVSGCDSIIYTILIVLESCTYPSGINATLITSTTAKISWSASPGATKYQIQYRPLGGGAWTKKNATGTNKTITGLAPSTTYQYKVKSICGAENSLFSPILNFTTLPLKEDNSTGLQFAVYPNPSNGNIIIQNNDVSNAVIPIKIYNMQGELVYNNLISSGNTNINLDLNSGIYNIIITSGSNIFSELIIISK